MNERFVTFDKLFIPDKELSELVEPGVRCLHYPPPILRWPPARRLLPGDSRCVASHENLFKNKIPIVPLIGIQEPLSFLRESNDHRVEHGTELTDIMSVRSGNDRRQRDAMRVHQEVTLGPFFPPDPWDSGLLPLLPEAP